MKRWTARRKFELVRQVVLAPKPVREELRASLMAQHNISQDEWDAWARAYWAEGKSGLRADKVRIGANG